MLALPRQERRGAPVRPVLVAGTEMPRQRMVSLPARLCTRNRPLSIASTRITDHTTSALIASQRDSGLSPSSDTENDFIAHFKLDAIWLLHAVGAQLLSFIVVYIFCPLYLKLAAENAGALSEALALFEKP